MGKQSDFARRVQDKIDVETALVIARKKAERGGLILTRKGQKLARKDLEATVKRRRK